MFGCSGTTEQKRDRGHISSELKLQNVMLTLIEWAVQQNVLDCLNC
jgi:hypothetical protein